MITTDEIVRGRPAAPGIIMNVIELTRRMNIVRKAWGKPMTITSGLRTDTDQKRINPKATRSAHIEGRACDVADNGDLYAWLQLNPQILEEANLYCELDTAPKWVHFQSRPFGSYKHGASRWFKA